MKKIHILIYVILLLPFTLKSQIGINTTNPLATLEVASTDPMNPLVNEGVIIPRVTSLNITEQKEKGLLVFLDYEDHTTSNIEKGFYWWNGSNWIPFFSMNKLTKDLTITYVSFLDTFKEGSITETSSDNRLMMFDKSSLIANDTDNFEVNTTNELVIKKAGTYHIQAIISIKSVTNSTTQAREGYTGVILVNGVEPNAQKLRTSYSFPNGGTTFNSNSTLSGFIKVNANDKITVKVNRDLKTGNNTTVTLNPNGKLSNMTLRYLGNF